MIKDLIHDPIFLAMKSEPATKEDLQAAQDLLDTLIAHKEGCVGMAANMIGVRKRIICFDNEGTYMTMFNPEIIKATGPYDAEEGCLSLLDRTLERAECKHVRFHDLRHTFATTALANGMDVKTLSAIIGHISSETTLNIYTHITDNMQRSAANKIEKGFGRNEGSLSEVEQTPDQAIKTPVRAKFEPKQPKIRRRKRTDQGRAIGIRCAKVNRHGFRSPWR